MSPEQEGIYDKLLDNEIESDILKLEGWKVVNSILDKSFDFKDFIRASSFMTKIAVQSKKMNHHSERFNVYNQLKIDLVTHDVNRISNFDIKLANTIDGIRRSE